MKKLTLLLIAGAYTSLVNGQTLTQLYHEPVAGDVHTISGYDSTSIIPKNPGLNQLWNFSSLTQNTMGITSSTFVAASSVPSASLFPGATLAEDMGFFYSFYRSGTNQFELLGSAPPVISINYTNSIILSKWPTAYNATFTDAYSGPVTGVFSGTSNGSRTVTATGAGTIVMPGSSTYSNILQVKTESRDVNVFSPPLAVTLTLSITQYDYYESTFKFPLLTVSYQMEDDGTGSIDTTVTISVNESICSTPVINITHANSVICKGVTTTITASGADTYSWSTGSANAQLVVTPSITTNYTLTGMNGDCAQTVTLSQVVSGCTGLSNEGLTNEMIPCYPNPFENELTISNLSSFKTNLTIFDALGNVVCHELINDGEIKTIKTENLANGIYIINLFNENTQLNKKLIKR